MIIPENNLFIVSRASSPGIKPCEDAFTNNLIEPEYSDNWFVVVENIIEFVKEHGQCVLSVGGDGFNRITIYDDYIE
jgi:hypothetical protein